MLLLPVLYRAAIDDPRDIFLDLCESMWDFFFGLSTSDTAFRCGNH